MNSAPRLPVLDRRRAGVLLHPTSLAGKRGAMGAAARAFIDWLADAGFTVWQVLPLGPVGTDRSPYWARSDFAFEPSLVDTDEAPDADRAAPEFDTFCHDSGAWLDDYVLFELLSRQHDGAAWWMWPVPLRDRHPEALHAVRVAHGADLRRLRVEQWQAATQWQRLRDYAHARGVRLFGDLPIYVAPNSVSTWAEREQFQLRDDGQPSAVAGVPPDYFAADGQLWGNPLYDWEQAQRDGFVFWHARLASALRRFDLLRIDHFRGLAAYWSVPNGAPTARDGQWRAAPGEALLSSLRARHAELPLVAEDLGVITPDVVALRRAFALPGMRVLQFGFDGSPDNPHLPHNYERDTVAYPGTHDNDTALGWYRSLPLDVAAHVDRYCGTNGDGMPRSLVRAALASVAQLTIVPMQDLLASGSEARFNVPGTVEGNWRWRMSDDALTHLSVEDVRDLNGLYGRLPHG